MSISLCYSNKNHYSACDQQVQDRQRDEYLPSQVHQLIIAEARKCPAYPHEEEDEECDLGKEERCSQYRDDILVKAKVILERKVESAKIKR